MALSAPGIRLGWSAVAASCVLAAVAAWAETQKDPAVAQPLLVPLVGLLLVAASTVMRGAVVARVMLALAAVTWLLGSLSVWLLLAHQGVLLLVLLVAATGRLHGWDWLFAILAIPMALGMLAQPVVGVVFLVVGARALWQRRSPATVGIAFAGALVGGSLVVSRWVSRADPAAFDPYAALLVYEGALVAAAGALVLGSRAEAALGRELVDRLVAGAGSAGLVGLAEVLVEALRAPGLHILRPPVARGRVDDLSIEVEGRVVAVVRHPVLGRLDVAARDNVAAAVGLVALGEDRRTVLNVQALAIEAAQRRIVGAQDEQRAATAARLRREVVSPLGAAVIALDHLGMPLDADSSGAVSVARAQILAATAEVEEIVHGAGPRGLGLGRLAEALRDMAARSPVPVDIRVGGAVAASEGVEAALYYVCAEALVNVHRHAHATHATVVLERGGDVLRLTVSDDGAGGADPSRSGLTGLADRVAMHGGRLRVDSPPGAGTSLTVELPLSGATPEPAATAPA